MRKVFAGLCRFIDPAEAHCQNVMFFFLPVPIQATLIAYYGLLSRGEDARRYFCYRLTIIEHLAGCAQLRLMNIRLPFGGLEPHGGKFCISREWFGPLERM